MALIFDDDIHLFLTRVFEVYIVTCEVCVANVFCVKEFKYYTTEYSTECIIVLNYVYIYKNVYISQIW